MLKKLLSRFLDPEVNRDKYPRHEYGDWEFIPKDSEGTLARIYTIPPMEKTFRGKKHASEARKWVHENMHLTKKGA